MLLPSCTASLARLHDEQRTRAQEGWLHVDAHILATPAIGDLNNDGHDELVVGVSWFFDREYYEDPVRPLSAQRGPGMQAPVH